MGFEVQSQFHSVFVQVVRRARHFTYINLDFPHKVDGNQTVTGNQTGEIQH